MWGVLIAILITSLWFNVYHMVSAHKVCGLHQPGGSDLVVLWATDHRPATSRFTGSRDLGSRVGAGCRGQGACVQAPLPDSPIQ
jgi:hypothetical protein